MGSLENKIREGLIDKKAEEFFELMKKPEHKELLVNAVKKVAKYVANDLKDYLPAEAISDILEFMDHPTSEIVSEMNEEVDPALKEIAYLNAKIQYATREEIKPEIRENYRIIFDDIDFSKEARKEFEEGLDEIYKFMRHQDKIILKLVEIAKKDGIEEALTDQAEFGIIRNIFPDPESFREHDSKRIKYLDASQKIRNLGKGKNKELDKIVSDNLIKAIREVAYEGGLQREYLQKKVTEIYGE